MKEYLASIGFTFQQNNINDRINQYNWIAYRRIQQEHRQCDCNENNCLLVIRPFKMLINDVLHESFEMDITAEFDTNWYKLTAYSLTVEDIKNRLPLIEQRLLAAWQALGDIQS